jgi:DEAD/DEAH box helicase domain-containing protein
MDIIVIDIETQNFFTDPGVGWNNYAALRISTVGVYSYLHDRYSSFAESEMPKLAELLRTAGRIVGFSINRYDIPVLHEYFKKFTGDATFDVWAKERVDILEEIELASGDRPSLSRLAEANLGVSKEHHGSEAITLYNEGRMAELEAYCLNDVKLTKELYDLYRRQRFLFVKDRTTDELRKVVFEKESATAKLF